MKKTQQPITQDDINQLINQAANQPPFPLPTTGGGVQETIEQRLAKLEKTVAQHEKTLKAKQTNARKRTGTKKT